MEYRKILFLIFCGVISKNPWSACETGLSTLEYWLFYNFLFFN